MSQEKLLSPKLEAPKGDYRESELNINLTEVTTARASAGVRKNELPLMNRQRLNFKGKTFRVIHLSGAPSFLSVISRSSTRFLTVNTEKIFLCFRKKETF